MIARRLCSLGLLLMGVAVLTSGCASMNHAFETKDAHPGLQSTAHDEMTDLPAPQDKVVAAVYQFRDQTGQYKAKERGSSFSRAVTQGGTSILMKALKDSDWFRPIERKGLSNLVKERDIIRSIRQQYDRENAQQLSPLLYAGILLEGGIIGYDTNVITGGGGFRLAAIGGSGQYRQDQVTVYLRAVSTQTGEVLKTVHTTKTILSQELDGGAFRYVDADLLLETEAGISYNEPTTMAVTEAIETSVRDLVVEGVRDGLFTPQDSSAARAAIADYEQRKERAARRDYFDRLLQPDNRPGLGLQVSGGGLLYQGDYTNPQARPSVGFGLQYMMTPRWGVGFAGGLGRLTAADDQFNEMTLSTNAQLSYYFVPRAEFTPFLRVTAGIRSEYPYTYSFGDDTFLQGGVSLGGELMVSEQLGLSTSIGAQYAASDALDDQSVGTYHDSIWQADIGLTYYGLGSLF
jgi:curli production assembly/transport component CsgG